MNYLILHSQAGVLCEKSNLKLQKIVFYGSINVGTDICFTQAVEMPSCVKCTVAQVAASKRNVDRHMRTNTEALLTATFTANATSFLNPFGV
jgi:hypothetical protein